MLDTIFVNLTPYPVTLRRNAANTAPEPDPTDLVIPPFKGPDGKPAPARVVSWPGSRLGAVEGLDEPLPGLIYIVSALVAGRVSGRDDVFSPGTEPKDGAVRTANGQVYAVTRLIQA